MVFLGPDCPNLRQCILSKLKRMRTILILCFLSATMYCVAQDPNIRGIQRSTERSFSDDTAHVSGWRKGAVISIGVGQGSSKNWAAGAEKFSFNIASSVSMFANLKDNKLNWRNTLDLGYALVNTTTLGTRKTDDKIDLFSKLTHDISPALSLGGVANFRSQFYKGSDYDYLGSGLQRNTSGFMAPAYIILAPGIDWHPTEYFSIFLSPVSARFVVVSNDPRRYLFPNGVIPDSLKTPASGDYELPLSVLYGVDPDKKVRREVGGFATINFFKEVFRNVTYKSRMDLYSNYLKTSRFEMTGPNQVRVTKEGSSPEKVDLFWTNLIVMKVNDFLNVSYGLDLIYDDDIRQFGDNGTSAATQFRSQLNIGFTARF